MTKTTKFICIGCLVALVALLATFAVSTDLKNGYAYASNYDIVLEQEYEFTYDGTEKTVTAQGYENGTFSWRKKIDGNFVTVSSARELAVIDVDDSGTYDLLVTEYETVYHSNPFSVTVKPLEIEVKILNTWNIYGFPTTELEYEIVTKIPSSAGDPEITLSRTPGTDAGDYPITGKCSNPNFSATFNEASHKISRVPVYLTFESGENGTVVFRGKEISLSYTIDSSVPVLEKDLGIVILYQEYDGNGLLGKLHTSIPYPGKVRIIPSSNNKNFFIALSETDVTVIPSEVKAESGIIVKLSDGFSSSVVCSVSEKKDISEYKTKHETMFGTQKIYKVFDVHLSGSNEAQMTVSVPVNDDNKHYTVAICKANGSLTYKECEVKDGYATFTVNADEKSFILWQDKDNTPFLILALILLIVIIAELAILIPLVKENRSLKNRAFAFALLGEGGLLAKLSIYTCLVVCAVEILVSIGLLIAILSVKTSMTRRRAKL